MNQATTSVSDLHIFNMKSPHQVILFGGKQKVLFHSYYCALSGPLLSISSVLRIAPPFLMRAFQFSEYYHDRLLLNILWR